MADSAALLVDEMFPDQPVRQWVLRFPYPLRFLFASRPGVMGQVLVNTSQHDYGAPRHGLSRGSAD